MMFWWLLWFHPHPSPHPAQLFIMFYYAKNWLLWIKILINMSDHIQWQLISFKVPHQRHWAPVPHPAVFHFAVHRTVPVCQGLPGQCGGRGEWRAVFAMYFILDLNVTVINLIENWIFWHNGMLLELIIELRFSDFAHSIYFIFVELFSKTY